MQIVAVWQGGRLADFGPIISGYSNTGFCKVGVDHCDDLLILLDLIILFQNTPLNRRMPVDLIIFIAYILTSPVTS
jgi:hypothetical protein